MSIFFNREKRSITYDDVFGTSFLEYKESNQGIGESSYYACINYISKAIAKLPLEILNI